MTKKVLNLYRWIFARQLFAKFNTNLFRLSLRGLGILNYENSQVSGERNFIKKILPNFISSERPVFFDVGANIGNYAIELINSFPNALIYLFEPHPVNYQRLLTRVKSNNVKVFNFALGSTYSKANLYDRADCNGSEHASMYEEVLTEIHKISTVKTKIIVNTIDKIAKREGVERIDFLKIDTEGHDLAVLLGAISYLENRRIGCIHLEFNEMNVVSRVFFRDFRKLLHNYTLYRLLPNDMLPLHESPLETELFAYQNIVAFPK